VNLVSLIIIGVVAMLTLALGIIFFVVMYQRKVIRHQHEIKRINDQKQLELIQASIQGEEEERMRIAAELHDDVGATLSSVRLFLHSAQKNTDAAIIGQSKELLDDSIQKIRNISHKLQPALLQQLGLQASLESFAAMMSKAGKIKMSYSSSSELPRMDENIEMSIYRIVQELTNNIIRHAGARAIAIETILLPTSFSTVMRYDGIGLTEETYRENIYKKGAIGLKNIVNRLKTINATIEFSKSGDEYSIAINTPIQVPTQN
jgi:signal transduction histidine kinase